MKYPVQSPKNKEQWYGIDFHEEMTFVTLSG